jgi:hypothetical protein
VFQAFDAQPDRDWQGDFKRSSSYREYVASGLTSRAPESTHRAPVPPPAPRSRLAQLSTLSRRYLAVIASDRNYLIVLAVLPIVLGALIRQFAGPGGLAGLNNTTAQQTLLVLVICACFTGAANSVRELVKERPIYSRERAAGLSAGAYLFSKLLVLGLITGLQAAVLVALGVLGKPLPAHGSFLPALPELLLAIIVLALACMALGLLVSAIVNTSEKTMPVLVLLSMAQVILSGGLLALSVGLNQLSWLTPARWGFAATASTVNLNVISAPGVITRSPLWDHKPSTWLMDMGLQILLAVLFSLIAWWRLVRLSPGRTRR